MEEWRKIPDVPYEVSSAGRVRSLDTLVYAGPRIGHRLAKGRVLKPGIASNGYPTIVLGRAVGTRTVHSLVAEAFIGPCPAGMEVRHKDGDRRNAAAANLEYGTRADNNRDAVRHGTRGGEHQRRAGLKAADTKDLRYPGWRQRVFVPGGFSGKEVHDASQRCD